METQQALLTAAGAVFSRMAYADARLRDIAEQAGISQGSLYFHFGNKDDVARAVLAAQQERMAQVLADVQERSLSGLDCILRLFDGLAQLIARDELVQAGIRLAMQPATGLEVDSSTPYALPVIDGLAVFEFGLLTEVFGLDRSVYSDVPAFDFRVCGIEPGRPVTTQVGAQVVPEHGFDAMEDADLIAVPAVRVRPADEYPAELLDALRRASDRGAILLSACSGAFILGAAGLLDGRACTTHWRYAEELQRRYPTARVDPDVLFIDDGELITSAGTAAGIDASLHLVRRELGSATANIIARNMVVPPQRDGGQRQYIERPVPRVPSDALGDVLAHMNDHLAEPHSVASLARRAHMSSRTFARRFVAETGVTPMQWLASQRVLQARLALESTDATIEEIAASCGFGSATLFRHHFTREVGIAPSAYRRSYACDAPFPDPDPVPTSGDLVATH